MRPTAHRTRRRTCPPSRPAGARVPPWLTALPLALLAAGFCLSASRLEAHETAAASPAAMAPACETPGGWVDVATGDAHDRRALYRDLAATRSVVLLGESHDNADHHRWELHTLAALHGRVEKMVIGFEAFPRRVQPALDDWVAGKLTEEAFLKASDWREVWSFDPRLYMPLFQFARLHNIPMVALNVARSLVSRVGDEGWAAVPKEEREGVSDPAPASPAYERRLVHAYVMRRPAKDDKSEPGGAPHETPGAMPQEEPGAAPHGDAGAAPHGGAGAVSGEAALAELMKDAKFRRFVEAQLAWDRAMAEALATARSNFPGATVAGIIGSGHLADGYGVPHQLKDLGVDDAAVLLPVEAGRDCQDVVGSAYADAVFTLPPALAESAPEYPKLGILITEGEQGVRIQEVVADSVAAATGLRVADEIVRAAGLKTQKTDELIEIVHRQAPGTWLPLSVMRDGTEIEFVAKFPPRPLAEP